MHVELISTGKKFLALGLFLVVAGCGSDGKAGVNGVNGADGADQVVTLRRLGGTESQGFAVSAAEIVAFDSADKRMFAVNALNGKIDVFDAEESKLSAPVLQQSIDLGAMLVANGKAANTGEVGAANSVGIYGDLAAVAVEANPKTDAGWVVFFKVSSLEYVAAVRVGYLPDMVTFTPDGARVVVACEGEPEDYTVDPEGSVDIIRVSDFSLHRAAFTDFNVGGARAGELPAHVRIFGKIVDASGKPVRSSTVAEDLEPEWATVSTDSKTAYVSLQENNAVAVIDLDTATVTRIFALGFKDYSLPGNELDASDKDDAVNIRNWPVYGMYMPDAVEVYRANGTDYLVTINEGDSRADWGIAQTDGSTDFAGDPLNVNMEEFRVKDLPLDPTIFSDAATLQDKEQLGRLKVTSQMGFNSVTGNFEELYAFGGRSFSIWNAETGELVFDSGSDFELLTAQKYGIKFNNNNDETKGDSRSDDKGPEPEGVALGVINGHTYAFIGLERMGGIMVYDISNPYAPEYVQYINHRDLTKDPQVVGAAAGDLGPEGVKFVDAASSPNGKPLVLVANEVSGTVAVYQVDIALLQD